jgi:hypothetical protein
MQTLAKLKAEDFMRWPVWRRNRVMRQLWQRFRLEGDLSAEPSDHDVDHTDAGHDHDHDVDARHDFQLLVSIS